MKIFFNIRLPWLKIDLQEVPTDPLQMGIKNACTICQWFLFTDRNQFWVSTNYEVCFRLKLTETVGRRSLLDRKTGYGIDGYQVHFNTILSPMDWAGIIRGGQ